MRSICCRCPAGDSSESACCLDPIDAVTLEIVLKFGDFASYVSFVATQLYLHNFNSARRHCIFRITIKVLANASGKNLASEGPLLSILRWLPRVKRHVLNNRRTKCTEPEVQGLIR